MSGQEHQTCQTGRAYKIRDANHGPVSQYLPSGEFAVGPGHHQQIIAGEEFGTRDHHQQQSEREANAAQHARGSKAECMVADHHHVIQRAQTNKSTGQDAQQAHRQQRQPRLGNAHGFDPFSNFLGRKGTRTE